MTMKLLGILALDRAEGADFGELRRVKEVLGGMCHSPQTPRL